MKKIFGVAQIVAGFSALLVSVKWGYIPIVMYVLVSLLLIGGIIDFIEKGKIRKSE
jgi:hypothetical protein